MTTAEEVSNDIKKDAGYAFNYIADVGNGQQFQITGSFPKDVAEDEVRKEFKKFRNVIEQHRTMSVIPNLKKGIAELELKLNGFEDMLSTVDDAFKEKSANGQVKKLTPAEAAQRANLAVNIKNDRAELDHKKKVLADAEKELE